MDTKGIQTINNLSAKSKRLGVIYGFLAAASIASYVLINRHVYEQYQVDVFDYTATFIVAGGLFGFISLVLNHRDWSPTKHSKQTTLMVFNGFVAAVAIGLLGFGQNYTTAVNASIILSASTLPTAFFAWILLKERLGKKQLVWLAALLAGLYFALVGKELLSFNKGDLLIIATMVLLGFTNVYSKTLMKHNHSDTIADIRLITGALVFVVLGVLFSGNFLIISAGVWPLIAGFCLWGAIKTFYASVHHINPNNAIVLANSHPMITPIVGILLLSEPYNWVKLVGSILILVSVYKITALSPAQVAK